MGNNAMKEVLTMGKRSIMNEELKYEIAKELGVDDKVEREGWGSVSSRDCGNMVRKAIEIAQRNIGK
jgi:small acid-soluble spore protein F (minor alpha/beta-type SASP)